MLQKLFTLLLLVTSLCTVNNTYSQERCGTKTPSVAYRLDSSVMAQQRLLATTPLLMKVYLFIIANSNGTNRAVADTTMFRQMENMRQFYAPHNICFILAGIEQINNTDLNSQDTDGERTEVTSLAIPGVLNVFVHDTLFNDDGALNGICYNIVGNCVSVARSAMRSVDNRSTLAHEIGHCFGLYHTFERNFGEENIDRTGQCTNCIFAGDLLCDTEADPHSDDDDSYNHITENCIFGDTKTQYCNGHFLYYNMNPHNIMAYGRRSCRDMFTNGQGARARGVITSALTPCIAPDDMDIDGVGTISSGHVIYTARTAVQVISALYTVTGSAKASYSSNTQVIFKPGTTLSPSGSGYAEARVSVFCQ